MGGAFEHGRGVPEIGPRKIRNVKTRTFSSRKEATPVGQGGMKAMASVQAIWSELKVQRELNLAGTGSLDGLTESRYGSQVRTEHRIDLGHVWTVQ